MPVRPAHSASSVMTLGTSVRTGIWRNRRSLRCRRSGSNCAYGMDRNIAARAPRRHGARQRRLTHPVQARAPAEAPAGSGASAASSLSAEARDSAEKNVQRLHRRAFGPAIAGGGACAAAPNSCSILNPAARHITEIASSLSAPRARAAPARRAAARARRSPPRSPPRNRRRQARPAPRRAPAVPGLAAEDRGGAFVDLGVRHRSYVPSVRTCPASGENCSPSCGMRFSLRRIGSIC